MAGRGRAARPFWCVCAFAITAISDTTQLKVPPRPAIHLPLARLVKAARPVSVNHTGLIFGNHEGGYRAFRIPAVLKVSNSTVLAFAEAREDFHRDYGHIDLVMKRSLDNGRTWGALHVLAGGPRFRGIVHGNPAPAYDAVTGHVLLVWCRNNERVLLQESKDLGRTWTQARDITDQVRRPGWGWMATGPGHGLQLSSGRIIIPFNSFLQDAEVKIFAQQSGCVLPEQCRKAAEGGKSTKAMIEITNPKDPAMPTLRAATSSPSAPSRFVYAGNRAGVFYSDDHGKTWQLGGMVNSRLGSSECVAAETPAGLLLSFRVEDTMDDNCRKMALSRDSGSTFEPFAQAEPCIPDPSCQGSLIMLQDGRLVTSGPGSHTRRKDLELHISAAGPEPPSNEGGGAANGTRLPTFRRLSQVAEGYSGYSDMQEVGRRARDGAPRVGLLYETLAGLRWILIDVAPQTKLLAPTAALQHLAAAPRKLLAPTAAPTAAQEHLAAPPKKLAAAPKAPADVPLPGFEEPAP